MFLIRYLVKERRSNVDNNSTTEYFLNMKDSLLTKLGLSASEIKLYQTVLSSNGISPVELAKITGIKRTTAYSMARGLVEKGLVVEDSSKRPRVFMAATPETVRTAMFTEKQVFEEKERMYQELAEDLEINSAKEIYAVPAVRFIDEAKIESFLRQQGPVWYKNMNEIGETTWWGFQDHTFIENFPKWIEYIWNIAPDSMDVKLLSNRASIEKEMMNRYSQRDVKYWGEAVNFHSTSWIAGDYVIMVNTRTKPFYLVEIHDKLMAHDQREVFRNLWPLV
jgi:DNA-binding MarR family transcriptional regulator